MLYKTVKILSVFGIFLALYLLNSYITKPDFQPCNINATINCEAVTQGPIREFAGIPVPVVGLTGYIFILIFAFMRRPKLVTAMALFGTVFCLRLTYIELFELHVICPVCLMCQIVMITITVLGFVIYSNRK